MKRSKNPTQNSNNRDVPAKPKELTPSQEELLKQTRKNISVRQRDGTEQSMSVGDAIIQKHIQTAASGSTHALNQVTRQVRHAEELEVELNKQEVETGRSILKLRQAALEECINEARADGLIETHVRERAKNFYPHPDDIIIHDKGYKLKGPFDEESLATYHYLASVRDAYLLQHALDERSPRPKRTIQLEAVDEDNVWFHGNIISKEFFEQRSSYFLAIIYNDRLPERFQLSEHEMSWQQIQSNRLTKRELLRECYRTWEGLNVGHPRGWLSPPIEAAALNFRVMMDLSRKAMQIGKCGQAMSDRKWMELIHDTVQSVKTRE